MFLNKQQFNISQNSRILEDNFDYVYLETITNAILQVLGFYNFSLVYFKEKVLQFVDITDKLKLAIEFENNGEPIIDF